MATTSILPLRLGSAILGRHTEPDGEAPPRISVDGECWELVTDPLLDIALVTEAGNSTAQAAFAARLANILHLNVQNLVVTEDANVNDLVAQKIAAAVASVIELDAGRITAGTIDTARLNATAIAAAVATVIQLDAGRITSGRIDTERLNVVDISAAVASIIELSADKITSGSIATARLDAQSIAAAVATIIQLNASRITTGTLSADRIAANSITSAKILVDGTLSARIVQAMDVATKNLVVTDEAILNRATIINGLAADVVSAATIYASQLVVAALDADGKLKPGTVDTVQIVDGAVRAAQIHAEEVAGAVARFLTIEVGQLTAGTAAIDSLVAQKIAAGTASFQSAYIKNLRSDGAMIDAAVIADLAANIITSGLFRTATSGQRWEIDSNGIVMYGVDEDGQDVEVVRLGPSGANLITVGAAAIDATGGVTGTDANFETLTVDGRALAEIIGDGPRGVVGWAYTTYAAAWDGTGNELRRLQAEAVLQPGRRYSVTVDQHWARTRTGGSSTTFVEFLRYEAGVSAAEATVSSPQLAVQRSFLQASTQSQTMPPLVGWIDTAELALTAERRVFFLLTTRSAGGRDARIEAASGEALRITVRDEGPSVLSAGRSWMEQGTPSEGAADAPPAQAQIRNYTSTFKASDAYSWVRGSSSIQRQGEVVQGYYSGVGNREGLWLFPSMTASLSGATITSITLRFYVDHTYESAGSNAELRLHGKTAKTTGGLDTVLGSKYVKKGSWVEYPVPSSYFNAFRSGTWRGFGLSTSNTARQWYMRARNDAQIVVKYNKPV